eukprot:6473972-Heterocapsa_arctica.AAC.1
MAKNTSKNKEDLGCFPKFLKNDDKIDLDAKTWSEHTKLHLARNKPVSVIRDWALKTPTRLGKGKKRIFDNN